MMPYIDVDYYINEYEGRQPLDPNDLNKLIKRASDMIDMLTGFALTRKDFKFMNEVIETYVKKATAALVEYYIVNGGYDATLQNSLDNVSLGAFKYSMRIRHGHNEDIPANVINFLVPTGLLYAGINTNDGCVYYER